MDLLSVNTPDGSPVGVMCYLITPVE